MNPAGLRMLQPFKMYKQMGKHRARVKKKIDALKDGLLPLSESKAGQLSGGFSADASDGSASPGEINGIISCGPINHNCPCGPTNSVAGCGTTTTTKQS